MSTRVIDKISQCIHIDKLDIMIILLRKDIMIWVSGYVRLQDNIDLDCSAKNADTFQIIGKIECTLLQRLENPSKIKHFFD